MKATKRYDQHRRDLKIDMICESCGTKQNYERAYDDTNFWVNVVPNFKCPTCKQSSNDLGIKPTDIGTKYDAWEVV